mmetsp:Transcript_111090/g.314411  ORF Transcript_111090/g.314411 Transcript_111090/m.314411 type:complete len:239 (+) Transcript_111090:846-1562(+)
MLTVSSSRQKSARRGSPASMGSLAPVLTGMSPSISSSLAAATGTSSCAYAGSGRTRKDRRERPGPALLRTIASYPSDGFESGLASMAMAWSPLRANLRVCSPRRRAYFRSASSTACSWPRSISTTATAIGARMPSMRRGLGRPLTELKRKTTSQRSVRRPDTRDRRLSLAAQRQRRAGASQRPPLPESAVSARFQAAGDFSCLLRGARVLSTLHVWYEKTIQAKSRIVGSSTRRQASS